MESEVDFEVCQSSRALYMHSNTRISLVELPRPHEWVVCEICALDVWPMSAYAARESISSADRTDHSSLGSISWRVRSIAY